ncbi:cobyrinate a,c-diamide synthase [Lentibacillus cibarius]|uniref:Cobyrinate a,c-diamide synthase n=1 Tax=Lentibacillus cibarius TaxID=2583219 RepID=A0A5S3QLP4_9BACI|nr:cobyrinate a,c-diamide synthase [Lentibacillus cibarius]TMN22657.1 cobyrinate a,c-diamide synthase [Lentibacillus cibarius]
MTKRKIVIAGTESGVGKTTVAIGLMSALKKRGLTVQGFKCGPDYIDPTYHTAVTGRKSRNLDSWMLTHNHVMDVFVNGSQGAEISVIEGVMGFFDGKNSETNQGSTAEISMLTKSPVLLVVNCAGMARSAAAIVKGFQLFDESTNIVGVIANKVGSKGHFELVKNAVEQECHIPVIGYLKREFDIKIPERHLGLIPSIERGELDTFFDQLGELMLETIDVDVLIDMAVAEPIKCSQQPSMFEKKKDNVAKIAVAKDAAFNFYYPENLEILEANGGELIYFSPLAGETIPNDVDGLYLGGGFPEEFASLLAKNKETKCSVKDAVDQGLPTLAECGGFMYLTDSIKTTKNQTYSMAGVIPGRIQMQDRLAALGYREVRGKLDNFLLEDLVAKGHEFHYGSFHPKEEKVPYAYQTTGLRGVRNEGYLKNNVVAGFTHFHFGSCPRMVENWLKKCIAYYGNRGK